MKRFILCISLITCLGAAAQTHLYYVYLVKGNAIITRKNSSPHKIVQKMFINQDDWIELKKDAEITLVDNEYKYFTLNKEGRYNIQDLSNTLRSRNSNSITQKYFALLWNELLNPNYDYTKLKKANLGVVDGGISRDAYCHTLAFPIDGLKVAEDSLFFSWHRPGKNIIDTFFIYDEQGKIILKENLADTERILACSQFAKNKSGKYFWAIRNNGGGCESDPYSFELMSKEKEQQILSSLTSSKTKRDILDHLQVVSELEKRKWILTAMDYFVKILKANPGNQGLVESYLLFYGKYRKF